jgi:S-adenosyl methyltransferase
VYVDNDPIVLAHARALLTSQDAGETAFIMADLREPKSILDHPTLAATLDLSQPVAVMLVAVLMYFRDTDDPNPFEMVATVMEPMPSGSYLAVTHPTPDFNPEETAQAVAAAEAAGITLVPRGQAEIARFFSGLDVVDPGVTPVLSWRPDEPPEDPRSAYYWAGMARKP